MTNFIEEYEMKLQGVEDALNLMQDVLLMFVERMGKSLQKKVGASLEHPLQMKMLENKLNDHYVKLLLQTTICQASLD